MQGVFVHYALKETYETCCLDPAAELTMRIASHRAVNRTGLQARSFFFFKEHLTFRRTVYII